MKYGNSRLTCIYPLGAQVVRILGRNRYNSVPKLRENFYSTPHFFESSSLSFAFLANYFQKCLPLSPFLKRSKVGIQNFKEVSKKRYKYITVCNLKIKTEHNG